LDEWFAAELQPRLRGPSTLVRFADDFVVILAHKDDAERVLRVLGKRLGKYGLELHPDKTQMIDFRFKPNPGTMIPKSRWPRPSTSLDSLTCG
jgi:RNA-directed DNA polymerase